MVKGEDKDLKKRVKALERKTKKEAKLASKKSKNELKDLRKSKLKYNKECQEIILCELEDQARRIEQVKKDISANANAVYGSEKRSLKRFLTKRGISEKVFVGLIVNFFFSIFEFLGGILSGSVAIMSDAIHDLGDAVSLGFSIYFERKAKRGPDKTYTYGYSRFSVLGVFVTTVILVVGASFMIYISILRLINPTELRLDLMMILSIIGLSLNTIATFRTKNGRFNVLKSITTGSVNGIILEDVIGWLIVLCGTIVMMTTKWAWLDPVMSICISIYLIGTSFNTFKKVLELFLEKVPDGSSVDIVKYQVLAIPHVVDVKDIHLWSMDGEKLCATMVVKVDGKVVDGVLIEGSVDNPVSIKKEIRKQLRATGISQVTIEIE
ncbi:cation diffusion facilitator family transporter [Candidatus Saccharibacteria bacterium]|nr:cation diffusion facilitator family transporter [Candidatus Saccharibacteria bacterium]